MPVSQKIGNQSNLNPAILKLNIYPKDVQSYQKNICSTVFIVTLFVIGKTWKQPRCPSTKEWISKMWYIYIIE